LESKQKTQHHGYVAPNPFPLSQFNTKFNQILISLSNSNSNLKQSTLPLKFHFFSPIQFFLFFQLCLTLSIYSGIQIFFILSTSRCRFFSLQFHFLLLF